METTAIPATLTAVPRRTVPPSPEAAMSTLIARQPVYDARHQILAWDIDYAPPLDAGTEPPSADAAAEDVTTLDLLMNALLVVGLERLLGNAFGFLPVTTHTLLSPTLRLLPPTLVVLTLPADIVVGEELERRMEPLQKAGYRFALDGWRAPGGAAVLLPELDFVRLDASALGADGLVPAAAALHAAGFRGVTIVTRLASAEEACAAQAAGALGFQGPVFRSPQPVPGSTLDTGRSAALALIAALNRPEATLQDLGRLIRQDPTLTYKLLRYVGSAYFGLGEVRSVDHALVCLGRVRLRLWATLIAMTSAAGERPELVELGLVRAGMCRELLLAEDGDGETGTVAGLLSVLDLLFGLPLERVLAGLPLGAELSAALLDHAGPAGRVLALVLAYERGDWDEVHAAGRDTQVFDAYFAALAQAHEMLGQVAASQ